MLVERMKSRGLGSLLCLVAALVALVTAVVFFMTQADAAPVGHTGIMPGVALVAGVVVSLALTLVPVRFGALVQAIVYGVALYLSVTQLYLVFADVINQVTYAGGNPMLCIMYMAGAFLSCLLCVVACFFEQPVSAEDSAASKRMVPVAAVLVVALVGGVGYLTFADGGFSFALGGGAAEDVKISLADNEYADMTIEDLAAISTDDWNAKEANGEVAYFFEGQYVEGFGDQVDPSCLDMYLYKDGSMHGTLTGPVTSVSAGESYEVYGYWHNVDDAGEEDFVIHLTGYVMNDTLVRATDTTNGEDADIQIFATEHGDYNWEASFSFGYQVFGGTSVMTRNMNIYGQQYAPAQSLTIDASALPAIFTGDKIDTSAITAEAVRGSGKTEDIWGGRLIVSDYDPSVAGTQNVTISFLGAKAELEVNVAELDAKTFTGTYGMVELGAFGIPASDKTTDVEATVVIDFSHKTVTATSSDGSMNESGEVVEANGDTVTITLNGSEPFDVTISGDTLTIPAHQESVSSFEGVAVYDVSEYTLTLAE